MIKACIFDLDGTLADTLESMAAVANELMDEIGLERQPVIISDIIAAREPICWFAAA